MAITTSETGGRPEWLEYRMNPNGTIEPRLAVTLMTAAGEETRQLTLSGWDGVSPQLQTSAKQSGLNVAKAMIANKLGTNPATHTIEYQNGVFKEVPIP
jgi:hypothetical protein